tara:strand:- start:211 stop:843 length:633 start_codon:yes stop_codon:yes gene_type:complete
MTLRLNGSSSGFTEIDAPAAAGSNTLTLPTSNGSANQVLRNGSTPGTLEFADGPAQVLTSGTLVASTSGTAIDFTGIPSTVKRITVMFNGVSTNGTSGILVQVGDGSIVSSGYVSTVVGTDTTALGTSSTTTGFIVVTQTAADIRSGIFELVTLGSNQWVSSHTLKNSGTQMSYGAGNVALSGTLDRIRITTTAGTNTFDAGTINIMYEG